MPLAVYGGRLLVVDNALATGCCCGAEEDEGGYWWCIRGKCYQSELSPDAVTHGRYMSLEACERRCRNAPGLCPCCEEPNVVTGNCEECEEACSDINGDEEACECEDYPYCASNAKCGCCMTCIDDEDTLRGRCVPCPDDTVCIDANGRGDDCQCVHIDDCLKDPSRCPIPAPPPGWGYECSRNLCGDPDCRLSRNGLHPTLLDCYRSCRDVPAPDCGIREQSRSSDERRFPNGKGVRWTDYLFSVEAAKSDICVAYKNPTNAPFRVFIKGPVLDRNCRIIASNVVHRDSGWRRGKMGCGCDYQCPPKPPKQQQPSDFCIENFPNAPFCCNEYCTADPCPCTRCCDEVKGCKPSPTGILKWRKRRGITYFIVRVLTDLDCGDHDLVPGGCLRVNCGECYAWRRFECDIERGPKTPEGACCVRGTCIDGLDECDCDNTPGGVWQGKGTTCDTVDCCAGFGCGGGQKCPAGCCCGTAGCTDDRNAVTAGCGPPCCLPDGGCQPNTHETVCAALGGVSMGNAVDCNDALCCEAVGKGKCPPGQFCCSPPFNPGNPNPPEGECCNRNECCVDGVCTNCDCVPPCPECTECIERQCVPCAQLNKQCCSGKCHDGDCPSCCTRNGCVGGKSAEGCRASGGIPLQGACTDGKCCSAMGANDCGAGKVCCGTPATGYVCCNENCCVDDVCDCEDECENAGDCPPAWFRYSDTCPHLGPFDTEAEATAAAAANEAPCFYSVSSEVAQYCCDGQCRWWECDPPCEGVDGSRRVECDGDVAGCEQVTPRNDGLCDCYYFCNEAP